MQETLAKKVNISSFPSLPFGTKKVKLPDIKHYVPSAADESGTPQERLRKHGALCKVVVSKQFALPGEDAISVFALIDPGAEITDIDRSVCSELDITIEEQTRRITSSTHVDYEQDTANFRLLLPEFNFSREIVNGGVITHLAEKTGAHVLLGRDVLQYFKMNWNGPTGEVNLDLG